MHLGPLEKWYVNGWFRGTLQRPLELAILHALQPFPHGAHVLDVGCGDGRGLLALGKRTTPLSLCGVDLDPTQIERARKNLQRAGLAAHLQAADAIKLPLPANQYDVATSFGMLHHVPAWQQALAEVARVLRHGGLLYLEEFYAPLLSAPLIKQAFPHPPARFTHADLIAALKGHGFTVLAERNLLGLAGLVVARRVAGGEYD